MLVSLLSEFLLVGHVTRITIPGEKYFIGGAAFILSTWAWRAFVARPGSYTMANGLKAGLASALFHYYVAWCLILWISHLANLPQGEFFDWRETLVFLATAPLAAFVPATLDFRYAGWLTIPLFGLIGAFLGWWHGRKRYAGSDNTTTSPPSGDEAKKPPPR